MPIFFASWRVSAKVRTWNFFPERLRAKVRNWSTKVVCLRASATFVPFYKVFLYPSPPPHYYTMPIRKSQAKSSKKFLKKLSQLLDKTHFALYNISHEKRKNNRKGQKTKQESFTTRDCWHDWQKPQRAWLSRQKQHQHNSMGKRTCVLISEV